MRRKACFAEKGRGKIDVKKYELPNKKSGSKEMKKNKKNLLIICS